MIGAVNIAENDEEGNAGEELSSENEHDARIAEYINRKRREQNRDVQD